MKIGDDIVFLIDMDITNWARKGTKGVISDTYTDRGDTRYKVTGLWFDPSELKVITKEKDPEYYL